VFRMDHAWRRDAVYYAEGDWQEANPLHKVHFGPIATGSKVMRDWELFKRLAFQSRKTLGVDMEAAAVGYTAYRTRRPMIVAKGVSDHADGWKNDAGQRDAALASARFVLSFLSQRPLPPRPTRTFGLQRDAYAELLAYVAAHKVESVLLIQYSNVVATDLLFELVRRGAKKVDTYVQHPDSMQGNFQIKRLIQGQEALQLYLSNLPEPLKDKAEVTYHFYHPYPSVRAVLIDDAVLAIGWYTYRHMKDNPKSGPPYMVRGAETPGTVVYRGSPDFEVFRQFIVWTAQEIGERAEKEVHVVTGREVEPPLPSPLLHRHSPERASEKS